MSITLSSEEIDELRQLEQDYLKVKLNLGEIIVQMEYYNEKLAELESEKFNNLDSHNKLTDRNKEINSRLQTKYGAGSINLETGILTLG